ncbi:MAG TPA: HEPN domain-containing protein [Planctomycetota bacterium]|nr:HEPN domain-containing protein [Planctomycetota bacterium]
MEDAKRALAREWLRIAWKDLISARTLAAGDDPVLETALYHCQQSAEKAVKGYLLYHDRRFEKTHDIRPLVTLARAVDDSFEQLRGDAALLTPYAQMFRYPEDTTRPTQALFGNAVAATERIYRFVLAREPELDPENQP